MRKNIIIINYVTILNIVINVLIYNEFNYNKLILWKVNKRY
jgi:hypothetical protein